MGSTVGEAGVVPAPPGVDEAVHAVMRRHRVPGLALAVVSRDRLLFARGYGLADLARQRPATAATRWMWFSMTKVVTATAVLRLADEGRLDLDEPAATWVPELRAPAAGPATVRDLLRHTAGLRNPLPLRWVHAAGAPAPDPEQLLRRQLRRRASVRRNAAGEARYSNLNYLALGQVVARATGGPFEAYVERAVLQPAGMGTTGFTSPPTGEDAVGYVQAPRVADQVLRRLLPPGVAGARAGAQLALNPFQVDGPAYGGLVGDVLDAGRFLRLHLGDGQVDGERVLPPATARLMRQIDRTGRPFAHGLGWFRAPGGPDRADRAEHYGTGAGFWNLLRLHPARDLGIAIMTNSTRPPGADTLADRLLTAAWH